MGNDGPSDSDVEPSAFELLSMLGKGAFGSVYLARKTHGVQKGEVFAIKQLPTMPLRKSVRNTLSLLEERSVMEGFASCPFLVTLHYAFIKGATVNLVMDFAIGGDLQYHCQRRGPFFEKDAKFYIAEIVLGLEALHRLNVIHRDLKTDNVMLDSYGHVLLTDFGLSKIMKPTDTMASRPCTFSFCGTREAMAPEIIMSLGYGYDVDWFALGVLAYELMTKRRPFTVETDGMTDTDKIFKLYDSVLNHHPPMPVFASAEAQGFLKGLLEKDPLKRLGGNGGKGVRQHGFFKDVDWLAMKARIVRPPFTPSIKDDADLANFSAQYTQKPLPQAEGGCPDTGFFKGFDFVAPV